MTTEHIIVLAKEKLGRDITEQEAQEYIDGIAVLTDEALDIVSGGRECFEATCSEYGSHNILALYNRRRCGDCGYIWYN